ncbi:MAG: radical SAM family heme chaperone HemW [Clostridiales bacterium]|nr:radical SAM family heme chaperone HemW [Clostridiales bacterium]
MKGIYIHIPFCKSKCSYCDFVSFPGREDVFDAYIDAVIREMHEYEGESADTVFIGGGTPTVLGEKQLARLLKAVGSVFKLSPDTEFTVEANPGTLFADKLAVMLDGGVNRLSIGVQSFDDGELRKIGRIHSAKTAYDTVNTAHKAGFSNISIDLMSALPMQSRKTLLKSLQTALELPLTHISVYSLIIEEGTPLARDFAEGRFSLPDEDEDREMYHMTVELLEKNGFAQYEISNFAKPGYCCAHNIKYWKCREYIGLGAAAHSYIGKTRSFNPSGIEEYISGVKGKGTDLDRNDEISEFMMLGLRMNEGVSEAEFKARFGEDMRSVFGAVMDKFNRAGATMSEKGRYYLTPYGMDIANTVMCEFIL